MRVELMVLPCSVTRLSDHGLEAVRGAAGAQLRRVAGAAGAEVEVLADDDDARLQRPRRAPGRRSSPA